MRTLLLAALVAAPIATQACDPGAPSTAAADTRQAPSAEVAMQVQAEALAAENFQVRMAPTAASTPKAADSSMARTSQALWSP